MEMSDLTEEEIRTLKFVTEICFVSHFYTNNVKSFIHIFFHVNVTRFRVVFNNHLKKEKNIIYYMWPRFCCLKSVNIQKYR